MKKTISTMIALALSVAAIGVAQQPAAPAAPAKATAVQPKEDPIVIAAGDVAVRQSEFENALRTLPAEYQQYASGPGKKQFADEFLRMKLLAAQGMKAGLDKDPEVLRQLALMRENLVANAQLQKLEASITVPDEELQKKYEASKNEYEQVKARHILIAFKGSQAAQEGKPELTDEQAKAKAEALHKQIAGGASFDELAKKESDDTGSGANGGLLPEFNRGQMVPEFENAAFAAKSGELTPVVRSEYGYHVIKVEEHGFTPFDQVKPYLQRSERQVKLTAALEALKSGAKTTYNDAYFAPPAPPPAQPAAQPAQPPAEQKQQ